MQNLKHIVRLAHQKTKKIKIHLTQTPKDNILILDRDKKMDKM